MPNKKILILHASFGSGHISAAEALAEAFACLNGTEVRVEDTFSLASPLVGTALSESYAKLAEKAPRLYGWLFQNTDAPDVRESIENNLFWGQLGDPFLTGLKDLIGEMNPDAIIATMQWPAMAIAHLKREGKIDLPFFVVVTDFIAHSTWFNYGVDAYFLPGDITHYQFILRGVPRNLLHLTGIPVKLEIMQPKPALEMRRRHGLPVDQPLITVFGGGIDSQRVHLLVSLLLEGQINGTVVTIAGRNQTLIDELADLGDGPCMKLVKLEKIDFVDDLVAASDVVITKAGGLIVSEVLARGTPMIIIEPLPGQEEWNADVVAGYGAGVQLRVPEMAALTALYLLTQPDRLNNMRQRAQVVGRPRAALDVAEYVLANLPAR